MNVILEHRCFDRNRPDALEILTSIGLSEYRPIEENIKRVVARPFSGSFSKQMEYFGKSFDIDVPKALNWLKTEPDSFEKEVLVYQLKEL